MFCKYCGQEVKEGTRRCPHCQRELGKSGEKRERSDSGSGFFLLLAVQIVPPLLNLVLFRGGGMGALGIPALFWTAAEALIGAAVMLALWGKGLIRPGRITGADALVWALWLYLPALVSSLLAASWYSSVGQEVMLSRLILQNTEARLGQLFGLWRWAELAVLCLARSGTLKVTAKRAAAALGILLAWSALIFAVRMPVLRAEAGGIPALEDLLAAGSGFYFLTIWVRRGFELAFAALLGSGRLPAARGVFVPVIRTVLLAVLTPVTLFTVKMGILSLGISETGTAVICFLLMAILAAGERDREPAL